ncbi:MAG: tRNA (adenosine(37)-N6)-threonylcarbamoyltransferase complex transferase subunit TsaD [bacterium]
MKSNPASSKPSFTVGIETSCDDTGVGLVCNARGRPRPVLNLVRSQEAVHAKHGGIVPELASRHHLEDLGDLLELAMKEAGISWRNLACVGVTRGPGLVGSLLVGVSAAKAISYSLGIPLIGINHLEAHLLTPFLMATPPAFPYVALIASGGHTELILAKALGDYDRLGRTRDDAAGEAFDKVGRLMGLGYPAGQAMDDLSRRGKRNVLKLPVADTGPYEFSFSGLKTAARQMLEKRPPRKKADFAAAFQEAVVTPLVGKSVAAALDHRAKALVVSGGVASNFRLRKLLTARAALLKRAGCRLLVPPPAWCTDNGLMVAAAAFLYFTANHPSDSELDADPSLDL